MTQYLVEWSYAQNGGALFKSLTVAPTSLAIKINRVEVKISSTSFGYEVFKYTGATSGGTTLTPTAMRVGAQAATSTCKSNVTSVSGTASYFVNNGNDANFTYTPPFSLMVAVGGTFGVVGTTDHTFGGTANLFYVAIYFDEQRLQGGF